MTAILSLFAALALSSGQPVCSATALWVEPPLITFVVPVPC